jgi:hypothetical protein
MNMGGGYGGLTPLSIIFQYIVAVSFVGGGNRSTRSKTTHLSQVTDKLANIEDNKKNMCLNEHWQQQQNQDIQVLLDISKRLICSCQGCSNV